MTRTALKANSRPYALDTTEEPERLDRQAAIAGLSQHLRFIPLSKGSNVLDAGCGSGSMTRILAKEASQGHITGVDLREEYLTYARRAAAKDGIENVDFMAADIFSLPFPDGEFDVVWSKYVLQWVNDSPKAVAEFKRVTRQGGTVVCCNPDSLLVSNYPVDESLQADIETALFRLFDPNIGRKMYKMFLEAGFTNIRVHIETDRLFSIVGAIDEERRANIAQAYEAFQPYLSDIFGSPLLARDFVQRHLKFLDRPDTISPCFLYFVQGEVS